MKLGWTLFFQMILLTCLSGQTYISPPYQVKTNPRVDIDRIEITEENTIIHFKYKSNFEESVQATACIYPQMYLQDRGTGKKYLIQRTAGIPFCPEEKVFYRAGYEFRFRLYFERLPYFVRYIDVIESPAAPNAFNFLKVYLQPLAH